MTDEVPKPVKFSSYHSDEPGCRANPATDFCSSVNRFFTSNLLAGVRL